MAVNPDDIVTFIIQHKVRATHREQYEQWLRDIGREAERYPGHLGTNVIRPLDANGQYTIIIRFDRYDHLKAWVESDVRRNYVRKVEPILEGGDRIEIKSGLDFWFTPPGVRANGLSTPVRAQRPTVTALTPQISATSRGSITMGL